ncbi:hypothetical protein SLE2022_084710 [Rubroshorea leprosula]
MDTPDRDKNHNNTPSSLSKFEDSPVFRYISSLSPIEPVKSIHTGHVFNPLTLASPSTLFPSPQIGSYKESRFSVRRPQFLEASSSDLPQSESENKTAEGDLDVVKQSDPLEKQLECITNEGSVRVATSEPHNEELDLAIELPKTLKYDCGSPDSKLLPSDEAPEDAGVEVAGPQGSSADYHKDKMKERQTSFESEINLRKVCHVKQNEEVEGYDWMKMVSDAADLLNFNSPITGGHSEGQNQKTADSGTLSYISTLLQLPQDPTNEFENVEDGCPGGFCKQSEMGEPVADQMQAILSSSILDNDPSLKVDDKGETCSRFSSEQRSIRRRCLVFEIAGSHKRKQLQECSSPTSQGSEFKVCNTEKNSVSTKAGNSHSPTVPRGIGLHLNSLANSSKCGKLLENETPTSGKQPISLSGSLTWSSFRTAQNPLNKSLPPSSINMNVVPHSSETMVIEESPQMSTGFVSNEADCTSPRKKRHKLEHEESTSCKRCNCKRSKCLKLYCECFAAGLYCIEPCSCRDCFNRPIHENIVLDTRKQIESRNPLAFAPKVIRSADLDADFEGESNKTPASARHKRGCNCKKSSCLKKYCECFQGGVGCSLSCRCEGCKNTFGRKDGADVTESEEEFDSCENNATEINSSDNAIKMNDQECSDLSKPSSEIDRPLIQQPFAYIGKPQGSLPCAVASSSQLCITGKLGISKFSSGQTRFKTSLQAIPEGETPEVLKSDCSSPGQVKATSPNSKRISPPHHEFGSSTSWRGGRKLILRSIPPFPSLSSAEK